MLRNRAIYKRALKLSMVVPVVGVLAAALVAGSAVIGAQAPAKPAYAAVPIGDWSIFQFGNPSRCMDVHAQWTTNGANVQLWQCLVEVTNQKWVLVPTGDGYYYIVAQHSGKCLDVHNGYTHAGANVHQWQCVGWPNQQWRLDPVPGFPHYVFVVARHSNMCLDVLNGQNANAVNIQQWTCWGGEPQQWRITEPF